MNEISKKYLEFSLNSHFNMITNKINNIEFTNENKLNLEVWINQIENIINFVGF